MKTTFTRMVYRCLLIAVVCCVLPLIGSTYARVAAQQPDPPPTPLLNVTITQPPSGGTFTATYPPGNTLQNGENTDIPKGTVLTLTAAPAKDYDFYRFMANDVEISSPYTVTSNVTLSVEFEPKAAIPVTITQPATGGTFKAAKDDGTELSDGKNLNCVSGDVLTLTEKPDPGYRLVKFTANGTEVSSPYTVISSVTLSVEFEQILHTVTIAQPEWGTITATTGDGTVLLNGANAVAEGTVLTLTNTPNYWYNRFNWYTANDRRTTSPYTVTSDVTLSAIFDPSPKPSNITIVQPATGGTFTATYPPGNTLQNGENTDIPPYTVVTLTATPDEGYEFVKFTEYGEEITSPYTVPPSTDIIFSAEFVQLHTVTITQPAEGGTFTATYPPGNTLQNGANTDIPEGTILTLTPASATGYRLVKFTADGAEVSSPYTVTGEVTISVEFEQILHTVTVTQPAEGGTFTATYPPGNTLQNGANADIPEGTVLTLTSTSATGYKFVKFTAGGTEVTSPYTVTGDVAISVEFEQISSPPTPTPPTPPSPPVDPGDDTPTVYYIVTLPAVEGATTDPVAGSYEVESWSNFRFFLTLDKEYDKSIPIVTTSRDETITPLTSDGAYIIKYVRQPLEILIDGIAKNPDPVANEAVKTNQSKVWGAEGHLHIEAATDGRAYIFTADGRLQKLQPVTAGETIALPLPEGVYIVRIGDERFKVLL